MAQRDLFTLPPEARRSPLAGLVSLVVHAAAVVSLMGIASVPSARGVLKPYERLTFFELELPAVEVVEPVPTPALRLELPVPQPLPEPEPTPEAPKPVEPVKPDPPAPPPPEPPVVKRPVVKVGEFSETPAARAPQINTRTAEVGSFESRETSPPRPGTDRPGVMSSPFDAAQAGPAATRARGSVVSSGFGAASSGPPQTTARQGVKAAGFAAASPTPAPANVARKTADERVTPAEVVFKPTPDYSAEARAQRIEGTVTLEVEFSASGQVRVLRVVRGLGYGLDEMAVRAAEQIRFKPALAGGKPVDFTANVQIVFHLT